MVSKHSTGPLLVCWTPVGLLLDSCWTLFCVLCISWVKVSLITNFKEHLRDEIGVADSEVQHAKRKRRTCGTHGKRIWQENPASLIVLSEVFIEQIFLRILESGNSDFLHKSRVADSSVEQAAKELD